MSDPTTDGINGGANYCNALPLPEKSSGAGASAPLIDTPHGLAGDIDYLRDYFVNAPKDPIGFVQYVDLLPQLLDRPGSSHEIHFSAPLRQGEFLSELYVPSDNQRVFADITIKDGYPEGELNFYPPIIQKNFKGEVDLPSHKMLGRWPVVKGLALDIEVHQIKMVAEPDTRDPQNRTKKTVRFVALVSHPLLSVPNPALNPDGFYMEIDVTELITRRYLGDQNQRPSIDFKMSRFIEMAAPHILLSQMKMDMIDMGGASFNIKATSDGTLPVHDGPYQFCTQERNDVCSSLQFHWDLLALSDTLTLHDVDVQVFVFPNPETGGFVVEIPSAGIGEVVQSLYNSRDGICLHPQYATTLTNGRLENVLLEIEPKDPNNLLAGVYLKKGKGTMLASGLSALEDIQVGSLGSGIDFEITGDANNNLSAHLAAPGFVLNKADLFLAGAASVHIDDAATLNLDALANFKDGVLSYSASMEQHLQCAAFSSVLEDLGVVTGSMTDLSCEKISLSSDNIFESHQVSVNRCEGSIEGNARLFGPLPLQTSLSTRFSDVDAQLTLIPPRTIKDARGEETKIPPEITLDHARIPNFDLLLKAGLKNYTANIRLEDGAQGKLNGVEVLPGMTIDTVDGVMTAQIDTTDTITIKGPQGTLTTTGQFLGTMKLVNINPPGQFPDFRPVVGSLNLEIDHGTGVFVSALGQSIRLNGRIRISDDASGKITIADNEALTKPLPIRIDTNATIRLTPASKTVTVKGKEVAAYDLPDGANLFFTSHVSEKHVGTFTTTGNVSVTGLRAGKPEAKIKASLPFGNRTIQVDGITVEAKGGGVEIGGTEKTIGIDFTPPKTIDIKFSQKHDGITYEFSGTLENNASFHTDIDHPLTLGDQIFTLRQNQKGNEPSFTGTLTVVATNTDGKVVGSGNVAISTLYQVSGDMHDGRPHFTIDAPITVLKGTLTHGFTVNGIAFADGAKMEIPFRGFRGDIDVTIDIKNLSNSRLNSTWDLPQMGSGNDSPEIFFPGIEIAGLEGDKGQFRNLGVDFQFDPQGQQLKIDAGLKDGVHFETLPGPDGQPRTVRLSFNVDEAQKRIVIEGTGDSSARVDGSVKPSGEVTMNVTNLFVDSHVNGKVLQPIQLDLNALDTLAKIPGLQVRYNPSTNKIQFTANPPQPNLPTPPKNFEEFFQWTPDQWRTYRQNLENQPHLIRLSEAHAAVQRALGKPIPAGKGDIFINFTKPLDVTFPVDGNLLANLTAALGPLADIRRALPAPPPCRSGRCSPVVLYNGQNPEGELYFTEIAQENGLPTIHSEVPGILQEALGVDRSQVDTILRDLRISVPDFIRIVRKIPGVAAHYKETDLRDLLESYFSFATPNGTFRQIELRGLITLANVRRSLGNLLQVKNGTLPIHSHVFRNDDYHAVSRGDGSDTQQLAILPLPPEMVEQRVSNMALDPWIDRQTSVSKSQSSGRLLNNYNYHVQLHYGREGNIRLVHSHLNPNSHSDLAAYTRTFRLVPFYQAIDPSRGNKVPQGTLVLYDEHIDFNGPDSDLPFPRMRSPMESRITYESFLNGLLRAFEPPKTNITRHIANHFAVMMKETLDPSVSGNMTYDSNRVVETSTVRHVDFLSLSHEGDALVILDTAQDAVVRSYLGDRLGIESNVMDRWLRASAGGQRQIPLEELRTASGLNRSLPSQSFRALARAVLNPPKEMADITTNFGSATERFVVLLSHLKTRGSEIKGPNPAAAILVFEDERFHPRISQKSRDQGDTVDSLNVWHIPPKLSWRGQEMSLDADRLIETIHHAEYYHRVDPKNFDFSEVVNKPSLAAGTQRDPNRIYTRSRIGLPGGLSLDYLISSIPQPLTIEGVGRLSAWRLEPSPQSDDFLDNSGSWLILPAEGGGWWLFRFGILNSEPSGSDNTGTVAEEGRINVGHFPEALITSALEWQRTGNPEAWKPDQGVAIRYRISDPVRISQ